MFDKLLDKATSPLLLEPDWETILRLCDAIKSFEVTSRHAIQSIKKKFRHNNPHVILRALQCLESIVKNCGTSIHKEVAQKDVIEALKQLVKNGPEQIRDKVLELIQCWSYGLGQQYKIFTDTFHLLKHENYRFPSLKQSEAMFENEDIPPEWKDDKQCFRCRQTFTTFIRKHHCRACGEVFCDKCSSKYCPLSKLGSDRYVRVCESCYEKLTTGVSIKSKHAPAPNQTKSQTDIDEEDTLQLALAISRSEADEKERQKKILTQKYATTNTLDNNIELNKEIQQNEHEETSDGFISDKEIDQFTTLITDHINNFKYRMLSDQQRHRNITIDTVVQSVFVILQYSHPKLSRLMQLLDDKQNHYENLQDKLNQLKDAREALNALRSEYYEHKQQEAFECERQRQIQLTQKLDLMRQKKQDYLEYQRQLILARKQYSHNPHLLNSSYTPMMVYPPNIDTQFLSTYPINVNGGPVYLNPADQVPLINSSIPYTQ